MTENEAIKGLETLRYQCKYNGECGTCNICCSAIPIAIQALEEIQQYRAIGTVEELKKAKEQFDNINSYANSIALCGLCDFDTAKESVISTIKAMKDEAKCDGCAGCTVWKCDDANIRANAIDEFTERIALEISESIIWGMLLTDCKDGVSDEIVDYVIDTSKKIAEKMKAGVEND